MSEHIKGAYHIRYELNVYAGDRLLAACGGHQNSRDQERIHAENVANARLFVKADAMYDAIQALLKEWDTGDFTVSDLRRHIEALRNALPED